MTITLELPYPPSVNAYWRIFAPKNHKMHPRIIVSEKGREYRKRVGEAVLIAGRPSLGDAAVRSHIDVYPGTRRKYDLDNIRKAVNDSLQAAGVLDDDAQIVRDSSAKMPVDPTNPRVVVTLTPIAGAERQATLAGASRVVTSPPCDICGVTRMNTVSGGTGNVTHDGRRWCGCDLTKRLNPNERTEDGKVCND